MYQAKPDASLLPTMKFHGIDAVKTSLVVLGVDQLFASPWQMRRDFSDESIDEMASSLQATKINFNPLIVCPRKAGGYYIICGERRWRGAQRGQLHELRCLVGDFSEDQAAFISICDNIQREEFNAIEEARSYQNCVEQWSMSHDEIAVSVGRSRGHVSNYIRLLSLDIAVRDFISRKRLSPSHGRLLCSVTSLSVQRELAQRAVTNKWSYKTLQDRISEILRKPKPVANLSNGNPDVARLERIISEHTGYSCVIRKTTAGNWQAGFLMQSNDEFAGLLERMGIDVEL